MAEATEVHDAEQTPEGGGAEQAPLTERQRAILVAAQAVATHCAATGQPIPMRYLPAGVNEPRGLAVLQGTRPVTEAGAIDALGELDNVEPTHPLKGLYSIFAKVRPDEEGYSLSNVQAAHAKTYLAHAQAWLRWNYENRKQYTEFIREVLRAFVKPVRNEDIYAVEMLVLSITLTAQQSEVETIEDTEEVADASA